MERVRLHTREFEAHGEQWQAVRHPSRKSYPGLLVDGLMGRAADVGLLFVSESGERRFLPMTLDDFPTRPEFENLTGQQLVELLDSARVDTA